jgi:drug/metabolite transporter (DMT)-like permease
LIPFLFLPGADYHPEALTAPAVWGNLLFLGLVASFVCFAVWNRIIKEIGVLASSNYIYLNPVFTMIAAALVLSERITWIAVGGLVLIAAGLWLAERVSDSRRGPLTGALRGNDLGPVEDLGAGGDRLG